MTRQSPNRTLDQLARQVARLNADRRLERPGSDLPVPPDKSHSRRVPRLFPGAIGPGGVYVRRAQIKDGRPTGRVFLRGFRRPVPQWARTELPPLVGAQVWGPQAVEGARELMREARRLKLNIAPRRKRQLCAIARGEEPLPVGIWTTIRAYLNGQRARQEMDRAALERSKRFAVQLGGGGLRLSLFNRGIPGPTPGLGGQPGG